MTQLLKTPPLPQPLQTTLRQTRRRLRGQAALTWLLPILSLGLLLTLLILLAGWRYPLGQPLWLLAIGVGLTGLLLGGTLLTILLRPYPPLTLAHLLDWRLRLDERLTTALELAADRRQTDPAIVEAQLADTLRHLQTVDVIRAVPFDFSWRWLAVANLLIIAIAAALLLPNPQVVILKQQAATEQLLEEQRETLEEIRANLLEDPALQDLPETEAALQTLDELIADLEAENLSPEEALADLAEAQEDLAALQNDLDQETTLNDLAESFNQFGSTVDLAQAIEERDFNRAKEFLESAAETAQSKPETAQNLAESLQQAAETAAQNGDEALAESLSEAAEALEQLAQSQGAQGANSSAQAQASQEALEQAAESLANAAQTDSEALEEALGNIQEARQQLAESGQGQGQGQQPSQGQPAQQGQGQGSGSNPLDIPGNGGGAGRGDPGPGANDLFADRPNSDTETDNGPNQDRTDEYEAEYPSIHWGGEGGPLVNPDQQGVEGGIPIGEAPVNPDQAGNPALVPYNEVYGQYADAAGEALDDTYIPLGMKEYVRNYFGALEPE